ncbi:GDP-fucose synthetase [Paramagnetospirillum kuznetsovii]|uniref:GDP-L-fucose synthase n=1 Tax=Paramagnetospirillum kuznetsovii TaxID=2053833 RepID=A0A364P2Q8_9PROT|nr:GDP-L-fucose synthase [Paramagnetospirillum kuznetsovii]RAU23614.1 GDP-fucose synthetase [Paramagnetospirillum kuznetsovii]
MTFDLRGKRVWVAGHRGMAGSAIIRRLEQEGCAVLTVGREDLDLRRQSEVEDWLAANRPDAVFLCAATVGGIIANSTRPAEFLYDNMVIEANVIHGAWKAGVAKLLFLGSNCIYPRAAAQPLGEELLLTGPLEPTNEWYAVAKIAGVKMCQAYRRQYGCDFISVLPASLFGLGDHYDPTQSHVAAALTMRIHDAKRQGLEAVTLWGTGTPLREFLYTEDMADGVVFLMKSYSGEEMLNLGSGLEYSIRQLAEAIAKAVGWTGNFAFDTTKPDGMPRKFLDSAKVHALGWRASTSLADGLAAAYSDYLARYSPG